MKRISFVLLGFVLATFIVSCEDDSSQTDDNTTPEIGEYTQKHVKNVLIEDFTGTWCGYCPRVAAAIDNVLLDSDNVIAVAVHDDADMGFKYASEMMTKFSITGYPTGLIDRKSKWSYPENLAGLTNSINEKTPLGLKIESSLDNRNANVNVSVEFAVDIPFDLSLVVCLTEDGILADQANYYDDGRGNPIVNFEHKHVLRMAATNIFGNSIGLDLLKKDNIVTLNYIMAIPESYNINKCHLVAFVTKKDGTTVYNAQTVMLGENIGFQYLTK